tara:strand:+ start:86 stop:301 length:216 start_codon:yes stop_codon:yes gene_type:complete
MNEEYENGQEDVPYVELELDIEDCRQIFTSTKYRLENWHFEDEDEKAQLNALNDFFYRVILEYNFKLNGED